MNRGVHVDATRLMLIRKPDLALKYDDGVGVSRMCPSDVRRC